MTDRAMEITLVALPLLFLFTLSALCVRFLLRRRRTCMTVKELAFRVTWVYIFGILVVTLSCTAVLVAILGVGGFRAVVNTVFPSPVHAVIFAVAFWNVAALYVLISGNSSPAP